MSDTEQDAVDAQAIASIMGTTAAPAQTEQPVAQAPVVTAEPNVDVIDTTALKLAGVPQSVLDLVPKSELQQWASQTKERETKRATDFQQLSVERNAARDELGRFKANETAKPAEPARPTVPAMDLEAELKPIVDELREMGVPAGNKLASVLKQAIAAQAAQVEGLSTVNKQLVQEVVGFFEDQALSKLEAQYPQLSDQAVRDRIKEEAQAFIPRYGNLSARAALAKSYEQAAKLVLFDDIVKNSTEQALNQHRTRLAQTSTAPTRSPDQRPMNDDERDTLIARLLQDGKPDEAMRVARG